MSDVFSLECCKFQYCPDPDYCRVSGCKFPDVESYIDPKHILSKKEAEEQEAKLKTMAAISEMQTEEWAKGMSPEILQDMLNIVTDARRGKFSKFKDGQWVTCIIKRLKTLTVGRSYKIEGFDGSDIVRVMNDKNIIKSYSVHHFIAPKEEIEESAKNFCEDLSRV